MNKKIHSVTVFLCAIFVLPGAIMTHAQTLHKDYLDGAVYWKIKNSVSTESVGSPEQGVLNKLVTTYHITGVKRPFTAAKSRVLDRIFRIEFADIGKADELIKELSGMDITEYSEKVPLARTFYVPNDSYFSSNQWQLTKINAVRAWDYSKGNPNITVAIIDDAIAITHPDLSPNAWVNTGEIPGNSTDDDGNGYVDDINGFDVADGDNNPGPPDTTWDHGTHVAGIAGAASDNNSGVASIGFGIRLIAVKATKNSGTKGIITHGYEGITYAVAAGAKVINLSWGGAAYSITSQNIINNAASNGVVVIAAAGNSGSEALVYPAAYNNVIAVASTSAEDSLSNFSNYGTWIDLCAPGNSIYSTIPGSDYGRNSGTSMSAPLVAGLCGLMLSVDPLLTPAQIESCLKSSAVNIDAINPGYAGKLGAGRINAYEAVKCASSFLGLPPLASFISDVTSSCTGIIKFSDRSIYNPASWHWDFGDSTSSVLENPVHTYAANGTYTVTLKVSNGNGKDSLVKTNFISVWKPADPSFTGASRCGNGTLTLQATALNGGALNWYDTLAGGNILYIGVSFTTPVLDSSLTYYVQETLSSAVQHAGPSDTVFGAGGYFNNNDNKRLIFDVYANITLQSVKVYANGAGNRTIEIWDGEGNLKISRTVFVPAGESRVTLNADLAPGTGYSIKINGTVDLYRNTKNAVYPYALPGILSITGVDAGSSASNYFYFYDWQVKKEDCMSNRVEVFANIMLPTPVIIQNGNLLTSNTPGLYQWYFNGVLIPGANAQSYYATQSGNYSVEVSAKTCTVMSDVLNVIVISVEEENRAVFKIYPNPVEDQFTIYNTRFLIGEDALLEIYDMIGERIYADELKDHQKTINCEQFSPGIYSLRIKAQDVEIITRIVKL